MGAVAALLSADAEFEPGRQRGLVMGSVGSSSTPWRCQRIEAGEGESHPASASNPPLYRRTGVGATPPTALRLAPGAAEAASEHVQMLLPRLRLLQQQGQATVKRIRGILDEFCAAPRECEGREHRDEEILLSLPGIGPVIAATMLAEASQPLRDRDYQALRIYAGAAPVTRRSGKRKVILMRYACNQRLRNALYHWSRTSMQKDARAKQHYAELRRRGHSHGRALRGLADRNLAMLMSMLKSGTVYSPEKRGTAGAQVG